MAPIALAFAILDLTGSPTDVGVVLAAQSIVVTALVLVGGVVADRISPRVAMVRADLVRTISMAVAAGLLLAGVAEVWELALLYALDGAATAFFNPASNAIVPHIVSAKRLQDANALLNISRAAGTVAGPVLAGVLLALGSPGAALAFNACTFAVSAGSLLLVRHSSQSKTGEPSAFLPDLANGWREFSRRTWLVAVVASAAAMNAVFFAAFQVLGPAVARDSLGGSSSWALIAALWGMGGVLGGSVAFMFRPRHPLLVSESIMAAVCLPLALLAVPTSTLTIGVAAFLAGMAIGLGGVLNETTAGTHIPKEALGRVLAYDWLGSMALEPVGLAFIGPLAALIGISSTLWLAATAMVLCQVSILLVPSVRGLEAGAKAPRPTSQSVVAGSAT